MSVQGPGLSPLPELTLKASALSLLSDSEALRARSSATATTARSW